MRAATRLTLAALSFFTLAGSLQAADCPLTPVAPFLLGPVTVVTQVRPVTAAAPDAKTLVIPAVGRLKR